MGGMEVGSIWGHGSYVAPDWSADWLHREAAWLLDHWAQGTEAKAYAQLDSETQAKLRQRLQNELRTNGYNGHNGDLVISLARAEAINAVGTHYAALFGNDPAQKELRNAYAIPANSIKTPERRELINAFFFWAAWSCAAERPGEKVSYTQNWPGDELVGNRPTSSIVVWSIVSFIALLGGQATELDVRPLTLQGRHACFCQRWQEN